MCLYVVNLSIIWLQDTFSTSLPITKTIAIRNLLNSMNECYNYTLRKCFGSMYISLLIGCCQQGQRYIVIVRYYVGFILLAISKDNISVTSWFAHCTISYQHFLRIYRSTGVFIWDMQKSKNTNLLFLEH